MTDPGRSGGEGTGWHLHLATHAVFLDDRCDCSHRLPRVVLDPVTARDTIARALATLDYPSYYAKPGRSVHRGYLAAADAILAALASQERGDG